MKQIILINTEDKVLDEALLSNALEGLSCTFEFTLQKNGVVIEGNNDYKAAAIRAIKECGYTIL